MIYHEDPCGWDCTVRNLVLLNDLLISNTYDIELTFSMLTENIDKQNMAFERVKFFMMKQFNQSLIVSTSEEHHNSLRFLTNNVITLPQEIADFYMTNALWIKLNTITEGHMSIGMLELRSEIGDGVIFKASEHDATALDELVADPKKAWWHSKDPNTNDWQEFVPWKEYGLSFRSKALTQDKKPAKIIKVKNFNPVLIKNSDN
jgi:hypothetical protein